MFLFLQISNLNNEIQFSTYGLKKKEEEKKLCASEEGADLLLLKGRVQALYFSAFKSQGIKGNEPADVCKNNNPLGCLWFFS